MIFPLSHEQSTVRRLPWVTFTIMGICLAAWIWTWLALGAVEKQYTADFEEFMTYYQEHPYLDLSPELRDRVYRGMSPDEVEAYIEFVKEFGNEPPTSEFLIAEEQRELESLGEKFLESSESTPWHEWGLIPAKKTLHGFITYQFMHGGWMHLIGNMFFLFLAGPFIEDRWGRPLYAIVYLGTGVVSAFMYAVHYPDFQGPLIGASGAVAGMMGAFVIRYWDTKIKFFYWFFVFFGTFTAPAWLMLPLWLLREFFFAQGMDTVGVQGGVAHWAHVWGFVSGLVVAGVLRYTKLEEKYLNKALDAKVTLFDNAVLEDALEHYRQGNVDRAVSMLKKEISEHPSNVDAAISFWNIAIEHGRTDEAAPMMMRVIQKAIRSGDVEPLDPYFVDMVRAVPDFPMDPASAIKLGEYLLEDGREDEAVEMLEAASRQVSETTPTGLLVHLARFGDRIKAPVTGTFVHFALDKADLPEEAREVLRPLTFEYRKPEPEAAPPFEPEPEPEPEPETEPEPEEDSGEVQIKVMNAVPVKIEDGVMSLKVGSAPRKLDLKSIKVVAIAGIAPLGERSYINFDLALDEIGTPKFRVVRLMSTQFDPRRLVGGEKPMEALKVLIATCFDLSGAKGVPGEDELRAGKFPRFASVEEYEESLKPGGGGLF